MQKLVHLFFLMSVILLNFQANNRLYQGIPENPNKPTVFFLGFIRFYKTQNWRVVIRLRLKKVFNILFVHIYSFSLVSLGEAKKCSSFFFLSREISPQLFPFSTSFLLSLLSLPVLLKKQSLNSCFLGGLSQSVTVIVLGHVTSDMS